MPTKPLRLSTIWGLGAARPDSRKLRWRCELPPLPARARKHRGAGATNANARRKSVGSRYSSAASPSNGTYGSCNSSSPDWADRCGPGRLAPAPETDIALVLPAVGLDADVAQHMVTEVVKKGPVARTIGPAEQLAQKTQRRGLPCGSGAWWPRLQQRGLPLKRSHS